NAQTIEGKRPAGAGVIRLGYETIGRARRRRNVVVDAAVLVVNDEQRSTLPEIGILLDGVVYLRDEELTGLHVVIRMLVGCDQGSVVPVMIVVIRLDEGILGEAAKPAIADELVESSKELRLVLEQVHDLHGRAGLIEVVDLCRVARAGLIHSFVNAFDRHFYL